MSISLYTENPYRSLSPYQQSMPYLTSPSPEQGAALSAAKNVNRMAFSGGISAPALSGSQFEEQNALSGQMRQMLRELKRAPKEKQNPFEAFSADKENGLFKTTEAGEEEDKKIEKKVNYNYKEVATKIRQAKTSAGAGQALLSAKRKVVEMKRKIAQKAGDPEDLQCALTHARRMEMVARKKKHHLELEELVVTTQKRDERLEQQEEAASELKNTMVDAAQEQIAGQEDEIFEERESMMEEAAQQAQQEQQTGPAAEDMLAELNQMLSEMGEKELRELEEAMEMLESLEVVDPHMNKEELEELKRKHRAAENKAMVKADMDYLKDTIRHQTQKVQSGSMPAAVQTSPAFALSAAPAAISVEVSMPGAAANGASVDVQV